MMEDEVFRLMMDKLYTLSKVYHNIQGGPEIQRKSIVQLSAMIAEIVEQLNTNAKGQI